MATVDIAELIRRLEALQDEQEEAIQERHAALSKIDEQFEVTRYEEASRLLGIAVGAADAYRHAADLLRGSPRPGGITFRAVGAIHQHGERPSG
jgi:hypothetical protein